MFCFNNLKFKGKYSASNSISLIFPNKYSSTKTELPINSALLFLLPVCISLSFYYGFPDIEAYAGLSGVLHGAYVAVALVHLSYAHERKFAAGVLGLIVLKLIWENTLGNTSTAELIGSPVLVEAHLLGAIWGMLLAVVYFPFHLRLLKPNS